MQVSAILDSIDQGNIALPEFQRGYVWARDQVRQLFQSLYAKFPVGSLLVWTTKADAAPARGTGTEAWQVVKLLLDGQQRITSLYGVLRGYPPTFFQGNEQAFLNLYFDVRTESFEFYGPVKMKGDPLWINVTELYKTGLGEAVARLNEVDQVGPDEKAQYLDRLIRVHSIRDVDFHVEEIEGPHLDVDTVVEIFNRVNSGGTKLSKGDLALAKICAEWPAARREMMDHLERWSEAGFSFRLDWLLRVTNAILTGEAFFAALKDTSAEQFQDSLARAAKAIDHLLNVVSGRLGLDHYQVLGGVYAFPVMARYVDRNGPLDVAEEDLLLFWYVHSAIWGRHSGSTETVLTSDLHAVDDGGLLELVRMLELSRGDLHVRPEHFDVAERGARFYQLLYLLTRVWGARDLGTGLELHKHLLGHGAHLEMHHIFPKARLHDLGFDRRHRNAIANFCFLTQTTNLKISARKPADYLAEMEASHPGVLASQWIPTDPTLWEEDRYLDFLAARRELLAAAANDFLDSLRSGSLQRPEAGASSGPRVQVPPGEPEIDDPILAAVAALVDELGLAAPELYYEEVDESGEVLVDADAAWPTGLQEGRSEPCAFLVEPDEMMETRLGQRGYRFFSDLQAFHAYVETLVGRDLDGDGVIGPVAEDAGGHEGVRNFIADRAPQSGRTFALAFFERAVGDLGLTPSRPATGERGYVNFLPPGQARGRVAAFAPSSGRLAIFVDPSIAPEYPTAVVVYNNGVPAYVKVYLTSREAVEDAVALVRRRLSGVAATTDDGLANTDIDADETTAVLEDDVATPAQFHEAMLDVYRKCVAIGYTPTAFLHMVTEGGGVEAARRLLHASTVSDGFTRLWEERRLDLSVEAVVLQPRWGSLFTEAERDIARTRLREFGEDPSRFEQ